MLLKNPLGFVTSVLKVSVTNPQVFFEFESLLYDNVDFTSSNLEAAGKTKVGNGQWGTDQ